MKKTTIAALLACSLTLGQAAAQTQTNKDGKAEISIGKNTFVTEGKRSRGLVSDKGIARWSDPTTVLSTYFRVSQPGDINLTLRYSAPAESKIKVSVENKHFEIKLKPGTDNEVRIGKIAKKDTGYVRVDFAGLTRVGDTFADLKDLLVEGSAIKGRMNYIDEFASYWGKRGPSVHMGYSFDKGDTIEWFYNEVTVDPKGGPLGSYYMANGFGEGYFGIQINSETERRVLFSVWSPFSTDNPKEIPDTHKIKLLAKGEGVRTGEFGNEGSGGQSFLVYPWKTGTTYKFLTRIRPDGKGATEYTAYFFATDENRWRLIASFSRPLTNTYYTRAHSFLENFNPELGTYTRKAYYGNQWARTVSGQWKELTKNARFSNDETGRQGARMDFKGGVEGNRFFLQNCGFFSDYVTPGSLFDRQPNGVSPEIDFESLPKE